jgi:hypothetical protein
MSGRKTSSAITLPVDSGEENLQGRPPSSNALFKAKLYPDDYQDLKEIVLNNKYIKIASAMLNSLKDADEGTVLNKYQRYVLAEYEISEEGVYALAEDLQKYDATKKRQDAFDVFIKLVPSAINTTAPKTYIKKT